MESNPQEALPRPAADDNADADAAHVGASVGPHIKRRSQIVMTSPPPHIFALFLGWLTVTAPRLVPFGILLAGIGRFCRERQRSNIGRKVMAVAGICWVAKYLHSVRKVHLRVSSKSKRLMDIVRHCPSLSGLYWPTWCAPQGLLQVLLLLCKEARSRLQWPYRREILSLQDGAYIALDWVDPTPAARDQAIQESEGNLPPVCVLLHGAFMDSSSVTMSDLACSLASRGFPAVVMNRRGYGGIGLEGAAVPKLAVYGFDEDLDEVLASVAQREPGHPVAIIGFSCGSGYAQRYVGRRNDLSAWTATASPGGAAPQDELPKILCMVSVDGAYDASPEAGPATLMRWPYSWICNWSLKYFYALRHRKQLIQGGHKASVDKMLQFWPGFSETYKYSMNLAGTENIDSWLQLQQPSLDLIKLPALLINSRDDPICVWENVELALHDINSNAHIAHAELYCGTHGCKFGFLGFSSLADVMVGEFVSGSWHELCFVQNTWIGSHACGAKQPEEGKAIAEFHRMEDDV